jgi:GDPmannose 4,6-dehydratase
MKRAIVIGAFGQDGTLLTELLTGRSYLVLGVDRDGARMSDGTPALALDILDRDAVAAAMKTFAPDEVYYLAAYHHSAQSAALDDPAVLWERSYQIHLQGLLNFLDAARLSTPRCRFFYASSSLIFGDATETPQTEETPFRPQCIYGITKTAGVHCCRLYRQQYGLHVSCGIFYNHESHLRSEDFVSKKVICAALRIWAGTQKELVVGDLQAEKDWGYAPDYMDAVQRMLQLPAPDDFVVATGEPHRVLDWVTLAFGAVGLDWRAYVREDQAVIKRRGRGLIGDGSKLRKATGWHPATPFAEMVARMMRHEGTRVGWKSES